MTKYRTRGAPGSKSLHTVQRLAHPIPSMNLFECLLCYAEAIPTHPASRPPGRQPDAQEVDMRKASSRSGAIELWAPGRAEADMWEKALQQGLAETLHKEGYGKFNFPHESDIADTTLDPCFQEAEAIAALPGVSHCSTSVINAIARRRFKVTQQQEQRAMVWARGSSAHPPKRSRGPQQVQRPEPHQVQRSHTEASSSPISPASPESSSSSPRTPPQTSWSEVQSEVLAVGVHRSRVQIWKQSAEDFTRELEECNSQ